MDAKVHALLNQQINKELYSAYLYLDFSNYFKAAGLDGFANWYMIQAQEERDHALLFMKYMQINGLKVTLEAIGKPDKVNESPMDPLLAAAERNAAACCVRITERHTGMTKRIIRLRSRARIKPVCATGERRSRLIMNRRNSTVLERGYRRSLNRRHRREITTLSGRLLPTLGTTRESCTAYSAEP